MDHRHQYVQQDGRVLETAIVEAPNDGHSHLRRWVSLFAKMSARFLIVYCDRILAEAEAGISKYELLMTSRVELHSTHSQPTTGH